MPTEEKNDGASDIFEKSLNAINSAINLGKAASGVAKGTAVGGPYGAIAVGLWQNRKTVGKIIAAVAVIFILPVLFILMLPSIIFGSQSGGGNGSDISNIPATNIMNDNAAIVQNISEIEAAINDILHDSHDKVLADINAEISTLSANIKTEITDSYSDDIFLNSDLIISQYCASKDKYDDINIKDLRNVISHEKDNLFRFTSKTDIIAEKDVDNNDISVTKITYTVVFSGDEYFA